MASDYLLNDPSFATRAIHDGQDPEQWTSLAVVPPISMSTTFKQHAPAQPKLYEYGRSGNPTRQVLETCLASLESGTHAFAFASGLGATTCILSMLNHGDHLITGDDMYGGTNRLISQVFTRLSLEVTFVDTTDPQNVKNAIKENTKMVFCETPTNPLLKITDIAAVAAIAKRHNLLMVVDNTFLTSYFQRPLTLGANIVMHSLTKYMNGHSDVIMGCVVTNCPEIAKKLQFLQNAMGVVPSPFDCSMVNRSLKTLAVRMKEHMTNGLAVARFLEKHPAVTRVIHPGLPSHPQHQLAKSQTYGHSGMLTFFIKGDRKETETFLKKLRIFTLAESLGGFESLAEIPSLMTHASVPEEQRKKLGITDDLIRLSVGLESAEDLIEDLDQALKAAIAV